MTERKPLKYAAFINRRALPDSTAPDFTFRYVDIGSVSADGTVDLSDDLTTFAEAPSRARRLAPEGATIVSSVRTYLRAIARVPESDDPLVFSTGFATLEARPGVAPGYLAYACRSETFIQEVISRSTGVSYPAINATELAAIPIPVPSLAQQERTRTFLDDQVGRIDNAIALRKTERSLLEERAFSAWAHEIDNAWHGTATARLGRFLSRIEQGGSPVGVEIEGPDDRPSVLKTSSIKRGLFKATQVKALANVDDFEHRFRLRDGDVLVVRGSGSADLVADCARARLDGTEPPIMLSDLTYRLVGLQLDPDFTVALLLSANLRGQLRASVRQGSGPAKVRGDDITDLRVPVLPAGDQVALAKSFAALREAASREQALLDRDLELLAERKVALITAVMEEALDLTTMSDRAGKVAIA